MHYYYKGYTIIEGNATYTIDEVLSAGSFATENAAQAWIDKHGEGVEEFEKLNLETLDFKKFIIDMYIEYVNNFLTVERFASYYGISEDMANAIINDGRKYANGDLL